MAKSLLWAAGAAMIALAAGASRAHAQATAAPPAPAAAATSPAPAALANPPLGPTLNGDPNPFSLELGPLGKIYVGGALTGLGLIQDNPASGDHEGRADLSNAQLFVQKTDGTVQFFLEAGAYSLPSLGTAYVRADTLVAETYGVLPVGYLKIAPTASFNIEIGKLPTLIGAESTFTFQNMNIERGLLWNQEPAISRGVQANYAKGPLTVSISWNDGFYSNRYNWISGLVAYAFNPRDSLTLAGGGALGHSAYSSFATPPVQNNGAVYDLIFTHAAGPLTITPYLQFTRTPAETRLGILHEVSTSAGAILVKYALTPAFSVAARGEYIGASDGGGVANLLYGPGSEAWSVTLTPTYQFKIFFIRGEVSYIRAGGVAPGEGFGPAGLDRDQVRGLAETGVLF